MRALPLRPEQPADESTVVVRAGVMSSETARAGALRAFRAYGVYGLSVEAVIGKSVLEACRTSERLGRHGRIRLSTFGRVRAGGFALLATFAHPHFTLVLPDLSEMTIARLAKCFDSPIANPGRAG